MQIASITTDEQGEYEYATEEDYLEQTLDIIIQKEGFERKNISYEIDKAEIKSDILLNELEKGTKEKTRIFGTIRNSKNRDPVKDASITLSIEGTQIASISSNEQGEYEYTADEDYIGQTLDFVIKKEGFIRKDISHEIDKFEIKSDFLMDEIEIKIKGKICDETDNPLGNASISFSIGGSTIDLVSDKDGSFSFTIGQQFLNQTIGYEANKEGFKIKSGKLKLIEDLRCINLSKPIPEPIPEPIPDPNRWIKIAAIGITLAAIAIILILIITPELSTNPDPIDFDFVPGTGAQTFSIWNDGYRTLEWDVSSDQDWIIVSPDSGTESGTVSVSVNSGGMDLGLHTGIITVESNGGTKTGRISLVITDETILDAPVIHNFSAEPKHIDGPEGETTLSWEVSGATSVTIDGIPVKVPAGSMIRVVGENTLFTLMATNDAGVSDVRDTKVYVGVLPSDLPIIDSFYANPPDISEGGNSTLYWEVSGATKVTIDRERMNPVYGNTVVYPEINTSYELTATNEAGEADSTVTVTVKAGPGEGGILMPKLSVDPNKLDFGTIYVGDEKSLTFEISNDGGGTLDWRVKNYPKWIEIKPILGSSGMVTVTNTARYEPDTYKGEIVIDSNGGNKTINVYLTVDDIKYVKYLVSQEKDLTVPNGLCKDGTKECRLLYRNHGGYYYAMVGNYVALNGNPEKLKEIIFEQKIDDEILLHVGKPSKISDGIELTAVEIDLEGQNVWLTLTQDGKELTSSNVGKGEIFTYTEKQIEGESDVPMFVAYVETMFAGMNTNMVKIRYVWSIIQ
ncbi:MAG: hypothetical protein HF976_15220 [ANME-2 cluster archaeon]|nr:hypothetical protein [ANME-2 cluster archaeon]MBC2702726.1 hypothetical protein [ANME-2 cluster archaeon]MBC2709305.1 hypothetical protein [ANME-2 cluster archaeon]MBC2746834.1 hypothetical protein [ANME-2 cluster archaeon]